MCDCELPSFNLLAKSFQDGAPGPFRLTRSVSVSNDDDEVVNGALNISQTIRRIKACLRWGEAERVKLMAPRGTKPAISDKHDGARWPSQISSPNFQATYSSALSGTTTCSSKCSAAGIFQLVFSSTT